MVRCSYQSPFCKSKKPPAAVTITQQRAAATATAVAAEGRGVRAPVQVFPGVGPAGARARFRAAERLASGQSPFAKAAPERMPEAAAQQRDGRNAEPPLEPAHQPDPHGQQQVGDAAAAAPAPPAVPAALVRAAHAERKAPGSGSRPPRFLAAAWVGGGGAGGSCNASTLARERGP